MRVGLHKSLARPKLKYSVQFCLHHHKNFFFDKQSGSRARWEMC